MSGHSKWSNIKRKKEANDKVKGLVFSKLSRLLTLTVVESGGITDLENNIKLRLAVDKAKQSNMPKEIIQRAINKGVGSDRSQIKEYIFEAFAPSGVGLIIISASDNHNRTTSEVRNILEQHEGKLGNQGSVSYLFTKCGLVTFNKRMNQEDVVYKFADNINSIDIDEDEALFFVYIPFENIGKVKNQLYGSIPETVEVDYKPNALIKVINESQIKKILSLIEALESLEDIQKVYANFDIADQYLK